MFRSAHRQLAALLLVVAAFLGVASFSRGRALALRAEVPEVDNRVFVPSPALARVLSLGENEALADLYWIVMLVYYGDGLYHDTGMPDTDALVRLVNTLDPSFRYAYKWGAYAVTHRHGVATEEEFRSSIEILRRALRRFPDDWELAWILGLRLFLDVRTGRPEDIAAAKEEGVQWIERAMHAPKAPPDLPILAAGFRTRLGQREHALRDLREMILNTDDPRARARLQDRYNGLASQVAGRELADEAARFDAERKETVPYAARSWYVLLGPPPSPAFDLAASLRAGDFDPTGAQVGTTFAKDAGQ